jgi:hypothetical protein
VNGNKDKLLSVKSSIILISYLNDNMLHINEISVTVCNTFSKIPSSTSVHIATRVRRSRFFFHLSWSSRSFYEGNNIQNATKQCLSCVHLSFFSSTPLKQKCNTLKQQYSINSVSVTVQNYKHFHMNVIFSRWPLLLAKILTFISDHPVYSVNNRHRCILLKGMSLEFSVFRLWKWTPLCKYRNKNVRVTGNKKCY